MLTMKNMIKTLPILGLLTSAPIWADHHEDDVLKEGTYTEIKTENSLATGRTDGDEGSEIGHGGFDAPSGDFYLALKFGAATPDLGGQPLMTGITLGHSLDGYVALEIDYNYLFNSNKGIQEVLVGGKVRATSYPIIPTLGLKAGILSEHEFKNTYFALVPEVGVEVEAGDNVFLGLNASADFAIGSNFDNLWKLYMNLGYRF